MKHDEAKIQVQSANSYNCTISFSLLPNELAGGGKGAKIRMGQFISMGFLRPGVRIWWFGGPLASAMSR